MTRVGVAVVISCLLGTTHADGPGPRGKLEVEVAPTFMGGYKQAATLILRLRNDAARRVELGYSDLEPFLRVTVTGERGAAVPCRAPKRREKRGPHGWRIEPGRSAVALVDLLARCVFPSEGTYRVSVVLSLPGKSSRFWTGTTPSRTSTLLLGGGSQGAPGDRTIPLGCIAYNSVPPDKPACHWVCGTKPRCSGVASKTPEPSANLPAYLCNGCMRDADCVASAGGRCVLLPGDTCGSPAYACVYPKEPCFPPARCDRTCFADADGRARCADPSPPPP